MSQKTIFASEHRHSDTSLPVTGTRLTLIGICLCAGGWLLLSLSIGARFMGHDGRAIDTLAQLILALSLIISGVALMLVNTLNQGFGALDRFFQAALARSSRQAPDETEQSSRQQAPARVCEQGTIASRPYVIYDDGIVAVETLLGVRLFNSLHEAQEFTGGC